MRGLISISKIYLFLKILTLENVYKMISLIILSLKTLIISSKDGL